MYAILCISFALGLSGVHLGYNRNYTKAPILIKVSFYGFGLLCILLVIVGLIELY